MACRQRVVNLLKATIGSKIHVGRVSVGLQESVLRKCLEKYPGRRDTGLRGTICFYILLIILI